MNEGGNDAEPGSEATPPSPAAEAPAPEATPPADGTPDPAQAEAEADESEGDEFQPMTVEQLVLPEGFDMPDDRKTSIVELVNKYQIPPEAVSDFMQMNGAWAQADAETAGEAWAQTQEEWVAQAQADPLIGGEKLEGNLDQIGQLINLMTMVPDEKGEMVPDVKYAADLRQAFDMTGAGNHPAVIRFLSDVAKQARVSEGTPLIGGRTAVTKDPLTTLYPSMQKG